VGFLDLPDQPDEPGRPERASASGADRPALKPRELPDPDERGRVCDAMRAHTSAETAGESSDAAGEYQPADAAGRRGYRGEVPRFMAMWADHETRWPADRRTTADPSADAPASHHGDGEFRQRSERQAEAADAVGRFREAEPGLSADAQAIEQENGARASHRAGE
jgi:hypothetical protein